MSGEVLPITRPWLGEEEQTAAARALASGWITQGPEVEAFESEFAAFVGAPHACAVSSGTAALHLALLGLNIGGGDEVVTVSHSFIATANAIRMTGAMPVFVDVQPDTYNIDSGRMEDAMTSRTRAIVCVHQLGMPCDIEAIGTLARRHGLPVIEDAACAAGSEVSSAGTWRKIGSPGGHIVCFSFHPRKVITTGEGGMLTTDDAQLDRRFRLLRHHGMDISDRARHDSASVIFESYVTAGYNYRMGDIAAAIGRVQLERLPQIVQRRRSLADMYRKHLGPLSVALPVEPAWARSNWQSYCVRLPDGISPHKVMTALLTSGIASRRGVICAHLEPAYPPGTWRAAGTLAHSEAARERCIMLPLFPQMSAEDVQRVSASLANALADPANRR